MMYDTFMFPSTQNNSTSQMSESVSSVSAWDDNLLPKKATTLSFSQVDFSQGAYLHHKRLQTAE